VTAPGSNGHDPAVRQPQPHDVRELVPVAIVPEAPLAEFPAPVVPQPVERVVVVADRITLKGRVGELAAWSIAFIAWGISLASQVGLALEHGFHGPRDVEALGDGMLPDLASLTMMCLALDQAERGKSARLTWALSILSGAFMEWANVAYAWPDPEAVALHAFPPFLVVATVFVLVHIRRTNAAPRPPPAPVVEPRPAAPKERAQSAPEPHLATAPKSAPRRAPNTRSATAPRPRPKTPRPDRAQTAPKRVPRGERIAQMRALLDEPGGRALTSEEVGERLGLDAGYARKLRAEVLREDA
jgi:hypothetical protein